MESIYDRALTEVGKDGLFQKKFDIIYNVVVVFFWAMAYMNIILALVVIPHTCHMPSKPENKSDYDWKLRHLPLENDTGKTTFSQCRIYKDNLSNSNVTQECESYDYDTTWYQSTVPSEYDWVCSKELYVANVFAFSRLAEGGGSLVFGWLGDKFGRRPTYIISLALIILGRLISVLSGKSYYIFISGCVIACLPSWSVVQSTTVISLESSSPERRTTTSTIRYVSWSFGVVVMPFFYWWLGDWKSFLIITTVPLIPCFLCSWLIIESPRWLWIEGNNKACLKYLKQIAKVNKTTLTKETEAELLTSKHIKKSTDYGPIALFFGWKLATRTMLQLLIWVSVTVCYTSLLINSGQKNDGNPFLGFALQALAEIPGNFIAGFLADSIGRRITGLLSFTIAGLMWFLTALRDHYDNVTLSAWWVGASLVMINRLLTNVSYYIINLLSVELYPTCLRQSGMALGNVFSSGASGIAPYILYLGRHVDVRLPGIILCAISMIGAFSTFMLPETLNTKLPETLEDVTKRAKNRRTSNIEETQKMKESDE